MGYFHCGTYTRSKIIQSIGCRDICCIRELEKKNADLNENLRSRMYAQTGRYTDLVKKYGRLKQALIHHGKHESTCSVRDNPSGCDCGLNDAILLWEDES